MDMQNAQYAERNIQEDESARATGEVLGRQEKVRVRVPMNPLNEDDVVVPVCINGHHYWLERGKTVEVPRTVADILEEAAYI